MDNLEENNFSKGEVDVHALFERIAHSMRAYTAGHLGNSVMHELSQPLTGILGMAEYLQLYGESGKDIPRDQLMENIGAIIAQSLRMVEMIRSHQRFSRPDIRSEPEDIEVGRVVASIVDILGVQFGSRGIGLNVDISAPVAKVCAVPSSLQEALYNLLFNAHEAIAAQGKEGGKVDIGVESSSDGFVLLSVRDSGEGIDNAIQQRIFEPFFTTRNTAQHAGLGLSAVHHIARCYGGHVTVSSEPGQGACFTLYLPPASTT